MNESLERDPLTDAIAAAGGPIKLAVSLGLHKTAVYKWDRCPPAQVIPVCEVIGWVVTPNSLRPDIYPNENDGLPGGGNG